MPKRPSARQKRVKKRVPIPAATKRKLLLEAGFQCSVPLCHTTQALEFHHINGDPSDRREGNLLVLCAVHHAMTDQPGTKLDRKACELLKAMIVKLAIPRTVDKAAFRALWHKAMGDETPSARAQAFESLAATLIESIPGLIVAQRHARATLGEFDIVVRNESNDAFLGRLAQHILVECKLRSAPLSEDGVAAFLGKLALHHSPTGFLFSGSGFTHEAVRTAGAGRHSDLTLLLIGPDEISDLIEAEDRAKVLKAIATRSLLA